MESISIVLVICFFFIAVIYASVGFGGGSSYLALLAQPLFLLLPEVIRPIALLCNIIVVTGGTIIFYKEGKIIFKEVWPFIIASVPLAYLGGFWKLKDDHFLIMLGITLILAAPFLWIKPRNIKNDQHYNKTSFNILLGGGIGFLSGMVGIGGGIFLAPILHVLQWSEAKKISALASVFILVNSISGLAGQFNRGMPALNFALVIPLLMAVFVGGQIGSRLGAKKFDTLYIKRITAILIFIAGSNILIDYL